MASSEKGFIRRWLSNREKSVAKRQEARDQRSESLGLPRVIPRTFGALGVTASLAIVAYAFSARDPIDWLGVVSVGVLVAVASLLLGGLLGFLFGIPRSLQVPDAPVVRVQTTAGSPAEQLRLRTNDSNQQEGSTSAYASTQTLANTNLEQISDWLTKILVGVGLTQIGQLPDALGRASDALAPAFGTGEVAQVAALACVVSFLVGGFLIGYVWTRVFLPGAFRWAEANNRLQLARREEQASRAESRAAIEAERAQQQTTRDGESLEDDASHGTAAGGDGNRD